MTAAAAAVCPNFVKMVLCVCFFRHLSSAMCWLAARQETIADRRGSLKCVRLPQLCTQAACSKLKLLKLLNSDLTVCTTLLGKLEQLCACPGGVLCGTSFHSRERGLHAIGESIAVVIHSSSYRAMCHCRPALHCNHVDAAAPFLRFVGAAPS